MNNSNFYIIPPYTIIYKMESGALEKIKGEIVNGMWVGKYSFSIMIPYGENDRILCKKINDQLAIKINWKKVCEKFETEDYKNLPSPHDRETKSIEDLLIDMGILIAEVDNSVIINGQPQVNISFNPEYKMSYEQPPQDIIDITSSANPKSEKKHDKLDNPS